MGQKQTYALQKGMSALPPIATAKADSRKSPCPLYRRKRTCAVQLAMSAMGQKRTLGHLLPFREQRSRAGQDDPDFGEITGLCIDLDRPTMLLHDDVVADGQA